jgi:hypothetical protein
MSKNNLTITSQAPWTSANHVIMSPHDFRVLQDTLKDIDTLPQRRARRADKLLSQAGYMQIGQYDIAHRMPSLPVFRLHGVKFVRPHYYAIVATMVSVLNHYKAQESITPLPNLDHLRLAEFLFHAPRAWWKTLDEHRAHILMCAEAGNGPDRVLSHPVTGASMNFQQATMHASPYVTKNTVYAIHNAAGSGIAQAQPSPLTPYFAPANVVAPRNAANTVDIPISPVTRTYETPLFTWLLTFTSPIRTLLLSNAAGV